ncbi:MAG: single-stranded DNA-binding protein [Bacteroidetes bacterium]|nr:single-stranded DNA-binding protein [Bacteroidota bacterium]
MNLRNRVQLIGHLGQAPEIKKLESGKQVARFSLATNENYTDAKGNKVTTTDWHSVVAWGKQAELAQQLLEKGKEVLVEGRLSTREYENADGQKVKLTEVVAQQFMVFGRKG